MAITTPAPAPPLLLIQLVGPEAVALVRKEGLSPRYSSSSSSSCEEDKNNNQIKNDAMTQVTVEQLKTLQVSLESKGQGEFFHRTILKDSRMVFPRHRHRKEEVEARAKIKETWRQQLHMRHQQREYDRMVKNVHWGGGKKPDPETRGFFQASLAFNMVAAMATAGFLGYYASGSYLEKDTHKVLVGILAGVSMLVIEMVLYIIRTNETERFRPKRERNEKLGQRGLTLPSGPLVDLQYLTSARKQQPSVPRPQQEGGGEKEKLL